MVHAICDIWNLWFQIYNLFSLLRISDAWAWKMWNGHLLQCNMHEQIGELEVKWWTFDFKNNVAVSMSCYLWERNIDLLQVQGVMVTWRTSHTIVWTFFCHVFTVMDCKADKVIACYYGDLLQTSHCSQHFDWCWCCCSTGHWLVSNRWCTWDCKLWLAHSTTMQVAFSFSPKEPCAWKSTSWKRRLQKLDVLSLLLGQIEVG